MRRIEIIAVGLCMLLFAVSGGAAVMASDDDDHDFEYYDKPVKHYEASRPDSFSGAIDVLRRKVRDAEASYNEQDFEEIHEYSYDMEEAVKRLEDTVEELKENIEELHEASELEKSKDLQEALRELHKIVGDMRCSGKAAGE